MADTGSLGVRAALGKALESEHADLLRQGVAPVLREVIEMEVARLAGGDRYERAEDRQAYRNGYRPRRLASCRPTRRRARARGRCRRRCRPPRSRCAGRSRPAPWW